MPVPRLVFMRRRLCTAEMSLCLLKYPIGIPPESLVVWFR